MERSISTDRPIEEGRTASYRMEMLDADAELRRLEAQVDLVRPLEEGFLDRAGLEPDDHLLDVGCGPGFFAMQAATLWLARGRITGVDVDPRLLAVARRLFEGCQVPAGFVAGTATDLPLPDDGVDFAYARFLFQHLDDPVAVLQEMARVTRPGGVVAVVDTDDGSLMVHPEPDGFAELIEASARSQQARGGDRNVGRKLKDLLLQAGLEQPQVHVAPLTSEMVPPLALVSVILDFKAKVVGPPWLPEGAAEQVLSDLRELAGHPGFFAHALGYAAWARVPAR